MLGKNAKGSFRYINRRKTKTVNVGSVKVGGDNPVSIQTMTNTKTSDAKATIKQIMRCFNNGAEIIRVSVPDVESTAAIPEIVKESPIPVVADVHFHYRRGIEAVKGGAHCIRINTGTLFDKKHAREIIAAVKDCNASIRIGINAGSLEPRLLEKYGSPCPEALVESALDAVQTMEDMDFEQIKISVKASDVMLMIKSYELLSQKCDYPLHLGVTEAGSMLSSSVKSSMGIGYLLYNGIGDTIRVSASVPPEEELPIAYEICKGLHIKNRGVTIISCPSCSRQQFDVINVVSEVERRTAHIIKPILVSILGCVVNGLGEAAYTSIGVTGAINGKHIIYKNGKLFTQFNTNELIDKVVEMIENEAKL
ncbi:MAG: flavodoxin-dependent (E)-4-hydroxy-3-methylbut-2-enyl-diphosphate synthase [Alphaproteobacteria bacterium]|nr:flavodoxin-dependent (E)-4-hydroxy-3-methylbut-2-enyl-diphosphate synthase [Rickettsiales bacterium]